MPVVVPGSFQEKKMTKNQKVCDNDGEWWIDADAVQSICEVRLYEKVGYQAAEQKIRAERLSFY